MTTLVNALEQTGGRYGLQTMCEGGGMANATIIERSDWLATFEVTLVGMESTGVYWKPVYYVLEDRFECWLLNARHLRNVPGRKTDVADSARLVEQGLVRPSFVPPRPRDLR
jgi:transposase